MTDNNQIKPPRSGIARIASVFGGILGALAGFRLIGREVRDLAKDLGQIYGEIHELRTAKHEEKPGSEQPRSRETPESGDVIDRKLEKIKPDQPCEAELPPGWNLARPHQLPRPTYWPAVLAGGVVVFAWGPPTSWTVSVVGAVVSVVAIRGWIGELRHESESE
jgi:hypothetical protein